MCHVLQDSARRSFWRDSFWSNSVPAQGQSCQDKVAVLEFGIARLGLDRRDSRRDISRFHWGTGDVFGRSKLKCTCLTIAAMRQVAVADAGLKGFDKSLLKFPAGLDGLSPTRVPMATLPANMVWCTDLRRLSSWKVRAFSHKPMLVYRVKAVVFFCGPSKRSPGCVTLGFRGPRNKQKIGSRVSIFCGGFSQLPWWVVGR